MPRRGLPIGRGNQRINGLLPQLIVMDRNGNMLPNGVQESVASTLKQLDTLLKQPVAQN